jgi:hypothetical protein
VRLASALLLGLLLALTGCGGSDLGDPLILGPSASMPSVAAGDQVEFACGLTITIPAGYGGDLMVDPSGSPGFYDDLSSPFAGDELDESFSVMSLAPDSDWTDTFDWPLLAASPDRTLEIRWLAPLGDQPAQAIVAVIVRLPDRPVGLVGLELVGQDATDDPDEVKSLVAEMWRTFDVQGAPLPAKNEWHTEAAETQ